MPASIADAHADASTAIPDQLDEGGVLVVGASATGVQLADEIHRSGRPVTLAVGEHVRVPRMYRGRDIHWWMDAAGVLDERYDEVDDIVAGAPACRRCSSPARPSGATLDLNALTGIGVKLVGRLAGIRDGTAQFSGSLRNKCALADLKMDRLLDTIDEWATRATASTTTVEPPHRLRADRVSKLAAARPRSQRAARSGRSSGRPASAPTTPGSTCRCSTARA